MRSLAVLRDGRCPWMLSLLLLLWPACGGQDDAPAEQDDRVAFERVYPQGCGSPAAASAEPAKHVFPKDFMWGTSVAGFQVDMGCPTVAPEVCEDRGSDWYQWVSDPEMLQDKVKQKAYLSGDPLSLSPGMWETWPHDLRCAKEGLHNNAIRLSLEWSRLFPDAAAEQAKTVEELDAFVDKKAAENYDAMLAGAVKLGLRPLVTLHHYTIPLWLHDGKDCHLHGLDKCSNRGWVDKDRMLKAIALYAGWCARRFGDKVDLWATLNEPFAVVLAGYVLPTADRSNPPGLYFQVDTAMKVAFNMMEAHARMYDAVRAQDTSDADGDGASARVGLVHNLVAVDPSDAANPAHVTAAAHLDHVYNRVFLEATINGQLDRDLDGKFEEQRPDMKGRMDWIGINYYTRMYAKDTPIPGGSKYAYLDASPDLVKGLWVDYPEGLGRVVTFAGQTYGLPVIITENGTASSKDDAWQGFVRPHLASLHQAMADPKVTVEGYFYWSLLDNYEWNHGMGMRFGMYGVDTANSDKARTPTALAAAYARAAMSGGF